MSGSNYGHVIGVRDGIVEVMRYHEFSEKDSQMFVHVAIVDGLGMAVRKDVWAEHPFDEAMLTGFHCYDIDFSLTISMAGYRNYAFTFGIIHFSRGSYEEQWLETTYKMLVEKWSPKLPYGVDGSLKDIDVDGLSASLDYDHIFRFLGKGYQNRWHVKWSIDICASVGIVGHTAPIWRWYVGNTCVSMPLKVDNCQLR